MIRRTSSTSMLEGSGGRNCCAANCAPQANAAMHERAPIASIGGNRNRVFIVERWLETGWRQEGSGTPLVGPAAW